MDFDEKLVDIILNERHDGDKDIDWLYGEYVKRGYNKSKEIFCEEFVMSMNGQDTNDLTESDVAQVAGGTGKFINRGASVGLAAALLAGPMMPTPRANVSDNISKSNQVKSNQGFAELAKKLFMSNVFKVFKVFNDADMRNVLKLFLATGGVSMFGAGSLYLISQIAKRISESETPEEVMKGTAMAIDDILKNTERSTQKAAILSTLTTCLNTLINFVPEDQKPPLQELYEDKFGTEDKPTVFNNWIELKNAFTDVRGAIKSLLHMQSAKDPLDDLFAQRKEDLPAVFESNEEPKNGENQNEDTNENENKKQDEEEPKKEEEEEKKEEEKKSYTTEELKDNGTLSTATGIGKEVLEDVDKEVENSKEGEINCFNLTKDTMLVVCKKITIEKNLADKIQEILTENEEKNLYLVLEKCTVNHICLPEETNIKVLDLRGNTWFECSLECRVSVEKVLLRNKPVTNYPQLYIYGCPKLGPIYQLSDDARSMDAERIYLSECHLAENFKFVNLNRCCDKLLERWCLSCCTCPSDNLDEIKTKSFDPDSQPDEEDLQGVETKK